MTENKTKPTQLSVAAFLETLPDERKRAEAQTLLQIMQRATGEPPTMWGPSIIGFGSHHYRYETGREGDMPVVSFSPRKNALVLYGLTGFSEAESWLAQLGQYTTGKGCLYIKKLVDIKETVLQELIRKSFEAKQSQHRT